MVKSEKYLESLDLSNFLRASVIKNVIDTMQLPPGSKGLDAGCGTGFYTLMLSEVIGDNGHVTGLDIEDYFLTRGRSLAVKSGLAERVAFLRGNIRTLPFYDNSFDWAFSMDLIGYLQTNPVAIIKELARTVESGGIVYILNWSSQMLLPGYPVLEARLNATSSGIAPFDTGKKPELHIMRALEWLHQADLKETNVRTYVGDISAPLSKEKRTALLDLFEMRWGEDNRELSEDDQLEYQRLCRVDSPDLILNSPGYYGFFTYSLFQGRVI